MDIHCPLCDNCCEQSEQEEFRLIHCKTLNTKFYWMPSLNYGVSVKERNVIYSFLLEKPTISTAYWKFYKETNKNENYELPFVNLQDLMNNYPQTLSERIDHILYNLYLIKPQLDGLWTRGEFFKSPRLFFCESSNIEKEISNIIRLLEEDQHYLLNDRCNNYCISAGGWERIESLLKEKTIFKQGFIAMKFGDIKSDAGKELINIQKVIQKSIKGSEQLDYHYNYVVFNDLEHNHYIMPEIFYQIKNSAFMVMDVTYDNSGAYYEAGYAEALGKEVIISCREDIFKDPTKKPHFDVLQKSMVLWNSLNELEEKLTKRIKYTVAVKA